LSIIIAPEHSRCAAKSTIGIAGLQQAGAPFWVSPVFNGTALLVAVSATYLLGRWRRAATA
jgi:hypothetical protein